MCFIGRKVRFVYSVQENLGSKEQANIYDSIPQDSRLLLGEYIFS